MAIRVYKARRRLELWRGGRCVFAADIALGSGAADGPKEREGDGRTPEGRYIVCTKNENSKYALALGISYPGTADASRAFGRGEIAEGVLRAVERAEIERRRPPWDTALGGFIMLHGEHPDGREGDWTAGCAALNNGDMRALFALAQIGEDVDIFP